jgi:hypothetical protein
MSCSALSRLIFDHRLRVERGVKRCSQCSPSPRRFCPSIHPKQSASSIASA